MNSKFFVPFETAKLLKEKGYPQAYVDMYYDGNGSLIPPIAMLSDNDDLVQPIIAAPTYHEVVDWLEGKKKFIFAEYRGYATYDWGCFIRDENKDFDYIHASPTREEALNAAILQALEMI